MDARTRNRGRRRVAGVPTSARGWLAPFAPIFHRLLDRIDRGLEAGGIDATLPDGTRRLLGGRAEGPVPVVHVVSWRALTRLALGGSAGWYEASAAGDWTSPDPVPLFDLFMRNRVSLGQTARAKAWSKGFRRVRHWWRRNSPRRARRNIAYHYDLGNDFYAPWLDAGMTYSSALFPRDGMTLEEGQAAKLSAVLERTRTGPDDLILEIGCGWGSFAEAAVRAGRRVHGITLSTEQRDYAARRVPEGARFTLTDYRDVVGTYDAVASIEMVEAVGREYWPVYLETISQLLKPGGRAAIQMICIDDAIFENYAANVDFIQQYIFPGGLLIARNTFKALAEQRGLAWEDELSFGLDYAETLRVWRERFDEASVNGRLPIEFDSNFKELWRYYLMYCEGGFRGGGIDVLQVTLVNRS